MKKAPQFPATPPIYGLPVSGGEEPPATYVARPRSEGRSPTA
ncbi:conserved hypothetical protein [Ahrensia sp. R2A130]|nr:conserved hypothetical protein [Ahrensia sp. R2A130]